MKKINIHQPIITQASFEIYGTYGPCCCATIIGEYKDRHWVVSETYGRGFYDSDKKVIGIHEPGTKKEEIIQIYQDKLKNRLEEIVQIDPIVHVFGKWF